MKRPGSRRTSPEERLLVGVGGSLVVAATLLLAPSATAAATAASAAAATATETETETGIAPAPTTVPAGDDDAPVPTDHGGLHRSTIAPIVPPGCAVVDVDLPLVEGVTWWVQTLDMIAVAELPQPLDPTASTTLIAVLSPGYVFEDGLTSAQWLVAPQGGDVSTGCGPEPEALPVDVPPVVVPPVVVPPVQAAPVEPVVVPVVAAAAVLPVPAAAVRARVPSRAGRPAVTAARPVVGPAAVAPAVAPATEVAPAAVPEPVGVFVSSDAVRTPGGSPPVPDPVVGTPTDGTTDRTTGSSEADRDTGRVAVSAVASSAQPGSLASADLVAGLVLAILASAAVAMTLLRGRAPSDGPARH